MTRSPIPVRASLGEGYRRTFGDLGGSLLVVALVQGVVVLVASPLLVGLFQLSLRASGLSSLTDRTFALVLTRPGGVVLVLAAIATMLALLAQAAVFVQVSADRAAGVVPHAASVLRRLRAVAGRLLHRPSTLMLLPYLLLVVPLGHAGIGSILTRWVAIPQFVTDELLKTPATAALYAGVLLVVWYLNLRLLFTVPLLVLTERTVPGALAASWRFTRWRTVKVALMLVGVLVPAAVTAGMIALVAIVPTIAADLVAPDAAAVVAAVSLGILEVVLFAVVGLFLLVQTQALVTALDRGGAAAIAPSEPAGTGHHRRLALVAGAGAAVAAGVLAVQALPAMSAASDGATLVLAHRGFTAGGVENTIPALEAASAAKADVVEMDVQQTSDGGWVLMHDMDLRRLAGLDTSIGALTLAQATAITVRDEDGHEAPIPSLEDYLARADELDQPLLIEIKVHGGESADYLDGLLALLDAHGGADAHIYHSLSADAVEGLKERRPDLVVGFIVPLAFGGVPDTPADFLVLEQGAYSTDRRDAIHDSGRGVFVWTVQEPDAMRPLFRDDVDGMITDHPDVALVERGTVADETGVAERLADALERLITIDR